ncbi:hypothetical protein [Ruminococcus sp.]
MSDNVSMKMEDYLYVDEGAFWGVNKEYKQSVHGKAYKRYNIALQQLTSAKKNNVSINTIIKYVQEFLEANGIKTIPNPVFTEFPINYSKIKRNYNLRDERDIVWMKFAQIPNGEKHVLGVVAVSNDINFDIPPDASEYDLKIRIWNSNKNSYVEEWKWNSAGILLHKLGLVWDNTFVLVFPLSNIPQNYKRHDIEKAIGNYLTTNKVPIIDYYSHLY